MTQYINKSTLVTEIEKLIKRAEAERVLYPQTIKAAKNYLLIEDYKKLLSIIDTLTVEIGVKEREQREQREHERMELLEQAKKGDENAYQRYVTFDMDR